MCHGCQSKKTPAHTNQWKHISTKVVLLGSSQSGKSSLNWQFVIGQFPKPENSLHDSFLKKLLITQGRSVRFTIWDHKGEKLDSSYLKDADAVLICFSVADLGSFEALEDYLDMARKESPPNAQIILVGNKCDLTKDGDGDERRKVEKYEAEKFAKKEGLTYVEMSAKEKTNVYETFEMIAKEKIRRVDVEYEKEEEKLKKEDWYCSIFLKTDRERIIWTVLCLTCFVIFGKYIGM